MFYGNESTAAAASAAGTDSTPSAAPGVARRFSVTVPCRSARADRCRPFKCSHCGRRSNWRWDLKKHIRASRHPNASVIELSNDEARRSFQVASHSSIRRNRLIWCSQFQSYTHMHPFNGPLSDETCGVAKVRGRGGAWRVWAP